MEKRQFEDVEHLKNALVFFMLASVRLLGMRNQARSEPETPAAALLEADEVQVLEQEAANLGLQLQGPTLTLWEAVRLIAQIGGHMGRKGDGPPGWITLWRGFQRLSERVAGFRLARALFAQPARQPPS